MDNSYSYFFYNTPFGRMTIGVHGVAVCRIVFAEETLIGEFKPTASSNACATQLLEYFSGKRTVFDIDLEVKGTEFQRDVWSAVESIPYAQTASPSEIASIIGKDGSYRLVGAALKSNPLLPIIPTHRVMSSGVGSKKNDILSKLNASLRKLEKRFSH